MKRILVTLGLIGWLCLPVLCHSVYANMKDYLGRKTIELIDAGKATHQDLDTEPWMSPIKGLSVIAETYRSRYFIPFLGIWMLLGVGLGANLITKKEHPTKLRAVQ